MTELQQATATLYEAFRGYPIKPKIEGCPHCELDSAESSLHARSLHDLTWEDLGVYPFKAMTTFGDDDDFKHFLPRILELYLVDFDGAQCDVQITFSKLEYASWTSWPETEKQAVQNFVRAWHTSLMASQCDSAEEPWRLRELELALAQSGFDLESAV